MLITGKNVEYNGFIYNATPPLSILNPYGYKIDLSLSANSILFGNSLDNITYTSSKKHIPNKIMYDKEIGKEINLNPYGVCYMASSAHFIDWWYWKHTGLRLDISFNELLDACWDYQKGNYYLDSYEYRKEIIEKSPNTAAEIIYGGHVSPETFINFNSKLSAHYYTHNEDRSFFEKYDKLKTLWELSNLMECNSRSNYLNHGGIVSKELLKHILFFNGPVFISLFWEPDNSDSSHAVLAIGYDDDYIYVRNSWGVWNANAIQWEEFMTKQFTSITWYTNLLGNLN